MQINSTQSLYNLNETSSKSNSPINTTAVVSKNQEDIDKDESLSLKTMSLEEIHSFLENRSIEDDDGSRAKALFDIQIFANRVDEATYNQMTNALLGEENSSRASMRYASFPTEEMLEEDPRMFHAMLQTTLSMQDTPHALIFHLNFKRDFAEFASHSEGITKPTLELDIDFSMMNFFAFMQKRLEEMQEAAKDGFSLQEQNLFSDFKRLFENYNNISGDFEKEKIGSSVNIWV